MTHLRISEVVTGAEVIISGENEVFHCQFDAPEYVASHTVKAHQPLVSVASEE